MSLFFNLVEDRLCSSPSAFFRAEERSPDFTSHRNSSRKASALLLSASDGFGVSGNHSIVREKLGKQIITNDARIQPPFGRNIIFLRSVLSVLFSFLFFDHKIDCSSGCRHAQVFSPPAQLELPCQPLQMMDWV